MCNSPQLMATIPPPSLASALAFTPASTLKKRASENAQIIGQLEGLIRAEKIELSRLARKHSLMAKRARSSHPIAVTPKSSSTPISHQTFTTRLPHQVQVPPQSPTLQTCNIAKTPHDSSPRGIMHSFDSPAPDPHFASLSKPTAADPATHEIDPQHGELVQMAARGSHWSFVEKARFEGALHKYGPFAWDDMIRTVGTRTDKQVKAYAARYRRRRKVAARMQALLMRIPEHPAHMGTEYPPPEMSRPLNLTPSTLDIPPASDVNTEPSLQSYSDSVVDAHPAPTQDIFGQECSSFETDMDPKNSDTSTLLTGDIMDDPMLGSTGDETISLSEGPSEVDLLLDRAIDGDVVIGDETKSELVQLSEDPSDFLSSLFNP